MITLFPGVHVLEGEVGGRPLQLLYLRGERASLLWDTGCADDPQAFIAPQIRQAGGDPAPLTWIVNSHSDLDHTGGNYAMKALAPNARLACGDADRLACSDPDALFRLRYDAYRAAHGIFYPPDSATWIRQQSGARQPVEVTFRGGEHILLSDDWEIEVLALPGHAHGHLGLYDRRHQALYGGDAMHGSVYLGFDGLPKLPPTYLHVDPYLDTIRRIAALPITTYLGCHWEVKRGDAIRAFCEESRAFVERADGRVLAALAERPHTLRALCLALGPQLGEWPHTPALDLELVFALHGHVARLVEQGKAAVEYEDGVAVYRRLV